MDTYRKEETIDGEVAFVVVIDTAGQEEYANLRAQYYRKGEGFIAVYSIADRATFQEVEKIRNDVLRERNTDERVPMVLVGNKCDLNQQREVTKEEGETLAKLWYGDSGAPIPFFETSAKENINIDEAFHQIVREIRDKNRGKKPAPEPVHASPEKRVELREAAKPEKQTAKAPSKPGGKASRVKKQDNKKKKKKCVLM